MLAPRVLKIALTVGADIFIGDRVITDQNGLVQIKFADATKLVVGPNSSMIIEDYLLREDGSAGKFAINALAGTFRFVTGNADHDEYSIKTPTGTLGVRGTAFDLLITAGLTRVLMYSGTTILCSIGNLCINVGTCGLGQSDATNAQMVGLAQEKRGSDRDDLKSSFPLANNQGVLLQEFQLDDVPQCRLAGPMAPAPGGSPMLPAPAIPSSERSMRATRQDGENAGELWRPIWPHWDRHPPRKTRR